MKYNSKIRLVSKKLKYACAYTRGYEVERPAYDAERQAREEWLNIWR